MSVDTGPDRVPEEAQDLREELGAVDDFAPADPLPVERDVAAYRWLLVIERVAASAALVLLVGLVLLQVVSRYVLATPLSWTEELARFALIALTALAAAYVMGRGLHITVDLFASRLGERASRVLDTVVAVAVLITCVLLSVSGVLLGLAMPQVAAPATGIPMWAVYLFVTVGFGLMALHVGIRLVHGLRTGASPHAGGRDDAVPAAADAAGSAS